METFWKLQLQNYGNCRDWVLDRCPNGFVFQTFHLAFQVNSVSANVLAILSEIVQDLTKTPILKLLLRWSRNTTVDPTII